jgi:hypothetical protein
MEPTKIIWKISDKGDGTATLVGYDDMGAQPMGEIILPTEWSGRTITGLADNLGGKITKLIVPGTYKDVRSAGSNNLQELILQEGVESVSRFDGSKNLWNVQLPSTLKEIGYEAFWDCQSITTIKFPAGLQSIGYYAFKNTGLLSVTLGKNIKEYGEQAFAECKNLSRVEMYGLNPGWLMFQNCVSLTNVTLSPELTNLESGMFEGCAALKEIKIPKKVTRVGGYVFKGCTSLAKITLPATVTTIEGEAFRGTPISKFAIPYGVKELGWDTFTDCVNLRSVWVPSTLQSIGPYSFSGCKMFSDVYYQAGKQQWVLMSVNDSNTLFLAADIHYNVSQAQYEMVV